MKKTPILLLFLCFFCINAQHNSLEKGKVFTPLNIVICSNNSQKPMTQQYTYDACPVGIKPIMLIENIGYAKVDSIYVQADSIFDKNRADKLRKDLLDRLPKTYHCKSKFVVHVHRLFNLLDSALIKTDYCKIGKKISARQDLTRLKLAIPPSVQTYRRLNELSHSLSKVMNDHPGYVGIDISRYQKDIDWARLNSIEYPRSIRFVIIKATEGATFKDKKFKENWKNASAYGFIRGAYHFYRPDADPYLQAKNFIDQIGTLKHKDIIPIIDLEKPCSGCSDLMGPHFYYMKDLKTFVQQLKDHYGTKVLFYSGNSYYYNYIKGYFPEDYFWLARYSSDTTPHDLGKQTVGWQFTNRMKIPGIKTLVDTNYFLKSSFEKLQFNHTKSKKTHTGNSKKIDRRPLQKAR